MAMIVCKEQRDQFLYFFFSGLLASVILLLLYFSLSDSANEQLRHNLKQLQHSLVYQQPMGAWQYNNTWRTIGNATKREMIYSAYFDARLDVTDLLVRDDSTAVGFVRVISLFPQYLRDRVVCVFRYDDFTSKEVAVEETSVLMETHSSEFAIHMIMCPLWQPQDQLHAGAKVRLPQAVALSRAANWLSHMSPTFVPISYPRNFTTLLSSQRSPSLAVCVGPLQFGYSDVLRIVEFVELYRLQGASHFYFYRLNSTEEVSRLLVHYRDVVGIATLLDWPLGTYADPKELYYGGIFGAINDCVYRAGVVDNHRYAAIVDLDEIIMPLKHNSLADYLRQCDEGRTSAFVFRNVFFNHRDFNDTFSTPKRARNTRLYTQTKVRRTVEVMPVHTRSKYVASTRAVIEAQNHAISRSVPGQTEAYVHPTVGLLFHYRDKCINCKPALMVEYSARRFGSLLWDRVDEVCLNVYLLQRGICPADAG